jgi:hypothetical protein
LREIFVSFRNQGEIMMAVAQEFCFLHVAVKQLNVKIISYITWEILREVLFPTVAVLGNCYKESQGHL